MPGGEALAGLFLAAYLGLVVPVVGLGFAVEAFSVRTSLLGVGEAEGTDAQQLGVGEAESAGVLVRAEGARALVTAAAAGRLTGLRRAGAADGRVEMRADDEVGAATLDGAGSEFAVPYISRPVVWTAPGSRPMPVRVTW
jgi:hypothetical protein